VIEIQDLYKYYGDRKAVGPLSCSIARGEIVGLLGLNGAGKTTTLRILACDLLPSSGSVIVDGLDVVEHPHEVRARIGYLPDTPPLYKEMTVRAYLYFAARLRGLSKSEADRRVPEVEKVTQVADVALDPIASLSHGYRQRVGIAQAIVHRPRLLVLDEPITGLDPVQIVEMRELLRNLKGEHTIVLSSHILSEISETCDRILVIKGGEIAAAGTEAELSTKLLQGLRAEITVRESKAKAYRDDARGGSQAREVAEALSGVREVAILPSAEPGEGVVTLRVEADHDIREALCKALVEAGIGILQVGAGERELESVFLSLAGATGSTTGRGGAKPTSAPSSANEAKVKARPDEASKAPAKADEDDDDDDDDDAPEGGADNREKDT
jgi:ABC-2 type transport system ATP-binding protein